MKCPDCGGEGFFPITEGNDVIKCNTCGGTGEVDKIRETESIIEELEDICNRNEYIVNLLSELKDNIVSRDKEIKKLKVQAECWKTQYMKLYERG